MTANLPTQALKPLQLYRALLREATYLPDPAAREWVHQHVVRRFKQRKDETKSDRIHSLVRNARKGLGKLQRANLGAHKEIQHVLMYTYGRAGPRRRKLIERIMNSSKTVSEVPAKDRRSVQPVSIEASASEIPLYTDRRFASQITIKSENGEYKCTLSQQFPLIKALLQSQIAQAKVRPMKSSIKSPNLLAPATNLWNNPMPRKRLKNMVKDWHATLVDKLLPPLPLDEFRRLEGLASGDIPWEGLRHRRPGIAPKPQDALPCDLIRLLDTETHLSPSSGVRLPPSWVQDTASERILARLPQELIRHSLLEDAVGVQRLKKDFTPNYNLTKLTPRMMRRIWQAVYNLSCTARWDSEESRFIFEWSKPKRLMPTPAEMQLFTEPEPEKAVATKVNTKKRKAEST